MKHSPENWPATCRGCTAWRCGSSAARDAAQEVAQDACVKALRGADKFDGRAALATWLHRITVNCAHDHLRKSRQIDRGRTDWDHDTLGMLTMLEAGPAEHAEQNETYRLALTPGRQIAGRLPLGIPADAVGRIHLRRGRGHRKPCPRHDRLPRVSCPTNPNGADERSSCRRSAMSISEEREILLSQLVDGELPVDQANQVLADVFDELTQVLGDFDAARKLSAMLELRRALDPWRRQEPPRRSWRCRRRSLPACLARRTGGC